MSHTVIVDINSIGNAANSTAMLTVGSQQTQAIFGTLRSINELLRAYEGWQMMVLWDGRAQWRFDMYPEYKSNRGKDPKSWASREAYKSQTPFIKKALQMLGVRQLTVTDMEADDVAGYLVKSLTVNPDNRIMLITGDSDWMQLVRPNVGWYDKRFDKKCTLSNLFDLTGYATPYQFLQGKVLQGDTSDVISPVGGIGKKGAPEFLAEFDSVENFLRLVDEGKFAPKYAAHKKLASPEGRAKFARNMKLMNLLDVPKPDQDKVQLDKGKLNLAGFQRLCEALAFHSFLKDFDNFTRPFIEAA